MRATKILFGLGLFVAFAFLVALFVIVGLNLQKTNNVVLNNSINIAQNQSGQINQGGQNSQLFVLDAQEVAKHNSASSCWMIVNSKVYDLTSFASVHSGGSSQILQDCGKDGSVGYNTKYGGGSHRSGDVSILAAYYIGDLGQQTNTASVQNQTSAIANRSSSLPIRRYDDD